MHIVGSKPTAEILKLKSDSINVSGFVTQEELSRYYKQCKVAVLPLRFGAGVKGKLIEAFYYQIPTVVNSVAVEGIPEVEKYTIIENKASKFALQIISLYSDNNKWNHFATKGKRLIEKYFSEESAKQKLKKVLQP